MIQAVGCAVFEQLAGQHAPFARRRESAFLPGTNTIATRADYPDGVWKYAGML
jgi:hypothetical protein